MTSPSGNSSNYDRMVWMLNSGQLEFGAYNGNLNTVTSSNSYNDGNWHQLVATQGPDGMTLYVDGQVVGTNPDTAAQSYTGVLAPRRGQRLGRQQQCRIHRHRRRGRGVRIGAVASAGAVPVQRLVGRPRPAHCKLHGDVLLAHLRARRDRVDRPGWHDHRLLLVLRRRWFRPRRHAVLTPSPPAARTRSLSR